MKPREFDELIRQQFDQNDFEYDPGNWAKLEERMGPAKKRRIALWWLMPAMGVAASVALALGVSNMWREAATGNAGIAQFATQIKYEHNKSMPDAQGGLIYASTSPAAKDNLRTSKKHKSALETGTAKKEEHFGIQLQNALTNSDLKTDRKSKEFTKQDELFKKKQESKKSVAKNEDIHTFNPNEQKKAAKLSISLLGGVNQGKLNNGYAAGATIRRMVTEKVYIESDIAFATSNNTQNSSYDTYDPIKPTLGKSGTAAKVTKTTNEAKPVVRYETNSHPISEHFNMSYAQISPSIGVKIMKKISVAAGPDFQQALADNRPVHESSYSRENISEMPLFDVGVVGKTEYSFTKNVKAQVSYRKGMNNFLTPMDKYIDRDYLQVQIRYSIFNK